ncbi:hydrogenase expression/formation protein HypE [Candidatus Bathyarchaeota archaeon]|nr:MAG: hydrogenase expression/formation protein HypE [Candidatus Bathyarchaeota archaeon]
MTELLEKIFLPSFTLRQALDGVSLDAMDDGASIKLGKSELVLTIDGHTVDPLFFPGGDIGRLAISGTVNDLAVMGARPVAILDAIIVEEGFPIKDLKRIIRSMDETAKEANVAIISGDFKCMPRGHVDGMVIATCGVGIVEYGKPILDSGAKPGDRIIVTGTVGDHGVALLATREGLGFEAELKSDVAPVWETVQAMLSVGGVHAMKDPTRGGLASALNEIARKSGVSIWLEESQIPVRDSVRAASEMLGIDPLEVTCEGRVVAAVDADVAAEVVEAARRTKYGRDACIIGTVRGERPGYVFMRTLVGGTRIVQMPVGEPIPRVC